MRPTKITTLLELLDLASKDKELFDLLTIAPEILTKDQHPEIDISGLSEKEMEFLLSVKGANKDDLAMTIVRLKAASKSK